MAVLSATRTKLMITTLNEIIEFSRDYTTENNTKAQLQVQLEEISTMADKFEDCQAQVENGNAMTEKECIYDRSRFRRLLFEAKSTLLELLRQHETASESLSAPS